MTDLEKRKRMLAAESEVYRELLKLELQNLRIYGIKARRKVTSLGGNNPLLMMALPLATSLFRRRTRQFSWKQVAMAALLGWQAYQRAGSLWRAFGFGRRAASEERLGAATFEEEEAERYERAGHFPA